MTQHLTLDPVEMSLPSDFAKASSIVCGSPCTSYWLAGAVRDLSQRDALDACRDAEVLAALMQRRLTEVRCGL